MHLYGCEQILYIHNRHQGGWERLCTSPCRLHYKIRRTDFPFGQSGIGATTRLGAEILYARHYHIDCSDCLVSHSGLRVYSGSVIMVPQNNHPDNRRWHSKRNLPCGIGYQHIHSRNRNLPVLQFRVMSSPFPPGIAFWPRPQLRSSLFLALRLGLLFTRVGGTEMAFPQQLLSGGQL